MTCFRFLRLGFRLVLAGLLLGAGSCAHAGIAQYSERGHIDFDTAMQLLNPYGTWAKVDGLWAYTPLDHQVPYTHGRWIYTEYGWYWKGDLPHSWATEHYGYWKRGEDHVWAWYPGPYWLPEIVELRATPTHFGWRSAAVDDDGSFLEAPEDRYSHTDEWTFVTRAQFAGAITPAILTPADRNGDLLDEAGNSMHTYLTYRPIERPGPHPADFLALVQGPNGGMFPPKLYRQTAYVSAPPVQNLVTRISTAAPSAPASKPAPASTTTTTVAATGADTDDAGAVDARQVPYWITMSLPSYWTPRPADAKPNEIYLYRPEFYQDQDGIERRIGLWLDPHARNAAGMRLEEVFRTTPRKSDTASLPPGTPAVPAAPAPHASAFHNMFDDSYTPAETPSPASSSKAAPAGRANPAPSGAATNGAP